MAFGKSTNLYPSKTPNVSNEFKLEEDFGVINVFGWGPGDKVTVEVFTGDECTGQWIPFAPTCCGQEYFCYPQTQIYLAIPNRYRFTFSNVNDNHLTDMSWFENLNVIAEKVSSDVDLSVFLKGQCEMSGCGDSVTLTREDNGCTTIVVNGVPSTICSGTQVTVVQTPNGDTILTIDGIPYVIPASTKVECADGGITIDGQFCETGSVVSFTNNTDNTGTLTIDGSEYTVVTEDLVYRGASPINVDGEVISIDISETLSRMQLTDCNGNAIRIGSELATCANLNSAIDDLEIETTSPIEGDGFNTPLSLDVPVTLSLMQLTDCSGNAIEVGADLATCEDLANAVGGISTSVETSSPITGNGTTEPITLDISETLSRMQLTDCTGNAIRIGSEIASCSNLNNAINALDASLTNDINAVSDRVEESFVDIDCGRTTTFTKDNGDEVKMTFSEVAVTGDIPDGSISVNETTPIGPLASTLTSIDITLGECGNVYQLFFTGTYIVETAGGGTASFRPQYSPDGGATWLSLAGGGSDNINGSNISQELTFSKFAQNSDSDATTILFRISLVANSLSGGAVVSNNTFSMKASTIRSNCC